MVNKEIIDLYHAYLAHVGVHRAEAAHYLTLAHILKDMRKAFIIEQEAKIQPKEEPPVCK